MTTFAELGLSPKLLKALEKTTMQTPTPIQSQAIPHIMRGADLMGLAQTGTGKTAAFGLPLLHRLLEIGHPPAPKRVRALILAPTRELVNQIAENFMVFTKGTAVKVTMVVGGASLFRQAERGGLAGAGLGQTHQIAARHDVGDGLGLNGGRGFQLCQLQGGNEFGGKPEGFECGGHVGRSNTKGASDPRPAGGPPHDRAASGAPA